MPIWVKIALVLFALALGLELWSITTGSFEDELQALHLGPQFAFAFRALSISFSLVPGTIALYASLHARKWARSFVVLCVLMWLLELVGGSRVDAAKALLGVTSCILLFLNTSTSWYAEEFQARFGGTPPSDRSRIVAFLLAFFFGFFGVHRFYLGKLSTGFVFLVLCIAGTSIGGLSLTLIYVESEWSTRTLSLAIVAWGTLLTWMTIDALQIWHGEMLDDRGCQVWRSVPTHAATTSAKR